VDCVACAGCCLSWGAWRFCVEQRTPGNLDPDEWAILRRVIDLIQQNAKGAELWPVLETIVLRTR